MRGRQGATLGKGKGGEVRKGAVGPPCTWEEEAASEAVLAAAPPLAAPITATQKRTLPVGFQSPRTQSLDFNTDLLQPDPA